MPAMPCKGTSPREETIPSKPRFSDGLYIERTGSHEGTKLFFRKAVQSLLYHARMPTARNVEIAIHVGVMGIAFLLAVVIGLSVYNLYVLANKRMAVTRVVHYASKVEEDANESRVTCVICLEDYTDGDSVHVLECEHAFHEKCLVQMKGHCSTPTMPPGSLQADPPPLTCPVCRGGIRIV
jgi:hypothetical protein